MACPVIAEAPGEHSHTTVAATSSGVMRSPRGEYRASTRERLFGRLPGRRG